jgi:hypothetical protein
MSACRSFWGETIPDTTPTLPAKLKKKCNSICYHACRESVAMDESRFAHINTHDNWADFLTKVISGPK